MARRPSYTDLVTKRQVMLERLKSGQVRNFAGEIKDVENLVRETVLLLDDEISTYSRTKLNKLLSDLRTDQTKIYKAATTTLSSDLSTISALYQNYEKTDLEATVDLRGTKLEPFTKKKLFKNVLARPLTTSGQLLEPWIRDFTTNEINRVNNAVRSGWSMGRTNQQIVQSIIGTKAKRYTDGVLQTTRRNASTVVRTSVQHAASAARQEFWEANTDVIQKYKWLSTLDGTTSKECRSLDGQAFEFGKGPVPPIHPNCRSTTVAVLADKYKFLSEGRTRSAEGGPVPAGENYYDWLKRQPASVQRDVLGPTRAKLFQDGGMSAEQFRKLQFDKNFEPLTLDEMRKLEPEAFKNAGLTGGTKPGFSAKDIITTHGDVDAGFVREVTEYVENLPEPVLTKLTAGGKFGVDIGDRVTIIRPDLKGVHPRGWPAGYTWDHADGFQTGGRISIAKTRKIVGNGFVENGRSAFIVGHETGHAFDTVYKVSTSEEFLAEYRKIRRKHGKDQNLKYFMQRGEAGPSETVAELFGSMYGQGEYTNFPDDFDILRGIIRKAVENG